MPPSPTLLELLAERFPDSSKTTLRKMLQTDRVRVNGAVARDAKTLVSATDHVAVAGRSAARVLDPRVRLLHEDDDLFVIEKAAGLLTVASPDEQHQTAEALLDGYAGGRPGAPRVHHVHRLDRDSSGVLVFARNVWARERLQEQFAAHDIERLYVAIVHGLLDETAGMFRSFLAEDRELRVRSVDDPRAGKEAITHYSVVAEGARYSMLELTLETGRRNQIRVHLAEVGHPIVGDTMYGAGLADPLGRLGLHAKFLGFLHPRTRRKMSFTADVPASFRELKL